MKQLPLIFISLLIGGCTNNPSSKTALTVTTDSISNGLTDSLSQKSEKEDASKLDSLTNEIDTISSSQTVNWVLEPVIKEEVSKEDIVLSDLERNRVLEESRKVNSEIVDKFESLVSEWENEIQINPQTKFSASTLDYKKLPQFKSLQEMGRVIIPLIMEKLLDENNFFMLSLYDALQVDSTLKVVYSKNDPKCLEGEQNRSRRTIRMWINSL